ncbi:tRNA (adenosine(37)-N6)-threonylcarbamoyltransferase complex ATPase subunit type 1 TsaE [Candidatus Pelagibacter sp.]|uniref:tRNA (adenosine(37)-N6)-threonylcarbamoyltransferase complex ATPase subunit type 1 TsaE n=1 Tax=Candidatus Pelagibacter sp. TaxID=2024849 RepID=UPI003F87A73C
MHIATSSGKIEIPSEKITAEIASELSNILKPGDIVFLIGEMGVGKTTLVRFLINELQKKNNIDISEVPSPTFNIMNEYQIKSLLIQHYDLYRLKNFDETKNLGIFEDEIEAIKLIEWPNILLNDDKDFIKLKLSYSKDYINREFSYENLIKNEK